MRHQPASRSVTVYTLTVAYYRRGFGPLLRAAAEQQSGWVGIADYATDPKEIVFMFRKRKERDAFAKEARSIFKKGASR